MQKICPHLWFDNEAIEAAEFYVSAFGANSGVKNVSTLHDTPSGSVDVVSFELAGQAFEAISAGPLFKFNPSVSFHVKCKTKEEVHAIWNKLSQGGTVIMELGAYPFSELYGWVQDKYGVSWQPIYLGKEEFKQKITPVLLFSGKLCGKAEEALNFYTSVFRNSNKGDIFRYGRGEEPDKEGTLKYGQCILEGHEMGVMDSAREHDFKFNEAISLVVNCNTQKEIDYYWEKLSADPKAEQCGWIKDKFGLSWQIVPVEMTRMLQEGSKEQISRVTEAFLKMKKFNLAALMEAFEGTEIRA
jgi:predicted 3-demethylubiquinone-9 3-methyltransferase (glyoxalase superfamily)